MARPDKAAAVAELAEEFRSSNAAVLTEYRGLTVKQLQELRRALAGQASYAVVKNTLTKIAARDAGIDEFDELLSGPSAIAFVKGDPVEAAKSLRDFARANAPLIIKGGVLDGKALSVAEISKLADLESREVLLAKLAGAMSASLQNAVFLLNAPLAKAARLAGALLAKVEADAPVSPVEQDSPIPPGEPESAVSQAEPAESPAAPDESSVEPASDVEAPDGPSVEPASDVQASDEHVQDEPAPDVQAPYDQASVSPTEI